MKSPFPGMDPFIEAYGLWGDFHHGLICQISNDLNDRLPDHYVSRIRERVYSDVTEFGPEEVHESYVEVQEVSPERQAVTHVEVLWPSAKNPKSMGREIYLRERTGILRSRKTNLVEIDLLRVGERMPMLDRLPNSPYTFLVARSWQTPDCHVWPTGIKDRVPTIGVPLTKPEADVVLELQPMIESRYVVSKYHRSINYSKPITPPLSAEETKWLEERLRQLGTGS
jgi:hypothetical protein